MGQRNKEKDLIEPVEIHGVYMLYNNMSNLNRFPNVRDNLCVFIYLFLLLSRSLQPEFYRAIKSLVYVFA